MSEAQSPVPSDSIKRIDIAEFRERGYLQELNRRFLHPLGLALEVVRDEHLQAERLGGVWDYREDPEGITYAELDADDRRRARFIDDEWNKRAPIRKERVGYVVQPVEEEPV